MCMMHFGRPACVNEGSALYQMYCSGGAAEDRGALGTRDSGIWELCTEFYSELQTAVKK